MLSQLVFFMKTQVGWFYSLPKGRLHKKQPTQASDYGDLYSVNKFGNGDQSSQVKRDFGYCEIYCFMRPKLKPKFRAAHLPIIPVPRLSPQVSKWENVGQLHHSWQLAQLLARLHKVQPSANNGFSWRN